MKYTVIPIGDYYIIVKDKSTFGSLEYSFTDTIIAQSKQIHKGVPLFDCPWVEDVESIATNNYIEKNVSNEDVHEGIYTLAFEDGYNKAKEKYKYTEEDIKMTIYLKNGFDKKGYSFYFDDGEILDKLKMPKKYEVELEIEPDFTIDNGMGELVNMKPRITDNKVTITKWIELK